MLVKIAQIFDLSSNMELLLEQFNQFNQFLVISPKYTQKGLEKIGISILMAFSVHNNTNLVRTSSEPNLYNHQLFYTGSRKI